MQKKMSTIIIIAAIAVVVAACSSLLGILAMSQAKDLEARVTALESAALAGEGIQGDSQTGDMLPVDVPQSEEVSLSLGDWTWENGTLVILSGYVRANIKEEDVSSAALDLCVNGVALEGCLLHMVPGEASGTVECELQNLTFPLDGENLDGTIELRFTVEQKNGEPLTAYMGGWSYEGGELILISG